MKKLFALLLVCFMALGVKAVMADTRTDALGLTAGQQVDDLDSIWLFPQDAANFGNVVDLRLGNPSYNWGDGGTGADWGGIIHKDFDEIGYIGVYFNRPFNTSNGLSSSPVWANNFGILNGWNNWTSAINPYYANWNLLYPNATLNMPYGMPFGGYPYWPYNIYTNNNGTMFGQTDYQWGVGNTYDVQDPKNNFDIFWAKDFDDATLGAHINYASSNGGDGGNGAWNYTMGTPGFVGNESFKSDSSVMGIDLGLTLKNVGPNTTLALGLGYSLGSVNYSVVASDNYVSVGTQTTFLNESIKDKDISEIRANALLKNKMNDTTTARIYGNARIDSLGFTHNTQYDRSGDGTFGDQAREIYVGTNSYTDQNFNLGLACEHSLLEGKAKVIAGLEVVGDFRKWTYTALTNLAGSTTADQVRWGSGSSYTEDNWMVPFNVAIEAPLFGDWLTARMGANTSLWNYEGGKFVYLRNPNAGGTAYQDSATETNGGVWQSNLWLTYGMTAKFNNLSIDMQLDPNALLDLLNNFAPGQGLLYGRNDGYGQTYDYYYASSATMLFQTIIQVDARYAF